MGCKKFLRGCFWRWCCCRSKENEAENEEYYGDTSDPTTTRSTRNTSSLVVQAIYDYNNAYCPKGDIQFAKDECFEILDEDKGWYIVQTESGKRGKVPSNFVEHTYDRKWYFEDVNSRLEAEILLSHRENPKDAFLIRRAHHGTNLHTHSLSVLRDEDIFHHFQIFTKGHQFFMQQGVMESYKTLNKLVQDCKKKGYISDPCVRESLPPSIDISEFKDDLIDFNSIRLIRKLGEGRSGQVYRGHWKDNTVAIKKIKEYIDLPELKKEAAILKKCIHKNIVAMYGICVKDTLMIVQEYISGGSVKDIMASRRGLLSKYRTLQYIGHQVACGMAYLEKRNYVHCDLAARNVLISLEQDPLIVKVADFGMAKCLATPIYVTQTGRKMPIRRSAPEVLHQHKVSIKGDVWSYGIFLMELFTNCRTPYHNISRNNEVLLRVKNGYRMGYPEGYNVSKKDFQVMQNCWKHKPLQRPTFKSLREYFEREGSRWKMLESEDEYGEVPVKR